MVLILRQGSDVVMDGQSMPSRDHVTRWWSRLAEGMVTRHEAHRWAARWVEGQQSQFADSMVLTALQYLHGYDMVYDLHSRMIVHAALGCESPFIKPDAEIRADLERWIYNCQIYDNDPDGYRVMMRRNALEALMDETAEDER